MDNAAIERENNLNNPNIQHYIVLQDFWLRDVELKKGQIITDPVSPRWIDLRLIAKWSGLAFKKNAAAEAAEQMVEQESEKPKKRAYRRRKQETHEPVQVTCDCKCECKDDSGVVFNVPEVSEVVVNKMNKPGNID